MHGSLSIRSTYLGTLLTSLSTLSFLCTTATPQPGWIVTLLLSNSTNPACHACLAVETTPTSNLAIHQLSWCSCPTHGWRHSCHCDYDQLRRSRCINLSIVACSMHAQSVYGVQELTGSRMSGYPLRTKSSCELVDFSGLPRADCLGRQHSNTLSRNK